MPFYPWVLSGSATGMHVHVPTSAAYLQMTSSDKDYRFMATNDLMAELQKDSIKLDDDSERKVSGPLRSSDPMGGKG